MTTLPEQHQCGEWLGDLSAYLDGEASAELCALIETHMRGCNNCKVMVDTLRKTITLYHAAPQPELSAEARARLFRVLDLTPLLEEKPA